jgi:hypothetical protein
VDEVRIPVAGDPFHAAAKGQDESPHACNSGWVSMEVETSEAEGEMEEVLYLCRRCAEEGS